MKKRSVQVKQTKVNAPRLMLFQSDLPLNMPYKYIL